MNRWGYLMSSPWLGLGSVAVRLSRCFCWKREQKHETPERSFAFYYSFHIWMAWHEWNARCRGYCVSRYLWWWVRALMDWSLTECCGSTRRSWRRPSSLLFYSFRTARHRTESGGNTTVLEFNSSGLEDIEIRHGRQSCSYVPLQSLLRSPKGSCSMRRRSKDTWCTGTLSGFEDAVETNDLNLTFMKPFLHPFINICLSGFEWWRQQSDREEWASLLLLWGGYWDIELVLGLLHPVGYILLVHHLNFCP